MDFYYVYLLSLFVLLVSLSIQFLFYKTNPSGAGFSLPPGKTGWPFLGESLEFLSTGRKGHPEKFILDRISKYSSYIFKTHLFGEQTAVFCGPSGNKFLFSNENKLVQGWWPSSLNKIFPVSTQTSAGEEALKARSVLPSFLNPEGLQRYVGIMDQLAQKHFTEKWENKNEILVFPLSKKYTFTLACKIFVSIEDPMHVERFYEHFDALCSGILTIPINFPGTLFYKAIKASNIIRKQIVDIVKQRKIDLREGKAAANQDMLSHMLVSGDGKFMDELDITDKILGLLIGGHDTASSVCAVIVKYLAELPEIYEGVYKEQMEIAKSKEPGEFLNWDDIKKMKYSWNVACEVLRLAPPLPGTFRQAIMDFSYNGFSIPKGWKLYWNANSTHRNPEFFPEPEKFDPSRFDGFGPTPYTFVPFGGGPRICPGKEYARLEILVFMHNVVKRFKWEKIIPDEKVVADPLPHPAKGLPIRLYPHEA